MRRRDPLETAPLMIDIDHDQLDDALRRAGSTWNAAQAHGLLSGSLAVAGESIGAAWLAQVLEGADTASAAGKECQFLLEALAESTHRVLSERQSQYMPLLPDDSESRSMRAAGIARWSEGYLHGLVSTDAADVVRKHLAEEPIAGIIKDLLAMTRAEGDDGADREEDEAAYAEIVEYLRTAAQVVYEELALLRPRTPK